MEFMHKEPTQIQEEKPQFDVILRFEQQTAGQWAASACFNGNF